MVIDEKVFKEREEEEEWEKSRKRYKARNVERGYKVLAGLWLMLGVCNFECARVLHENLLVHVLMYGSETMIWLEEER